MLLNVKKLKPGVARKVHVLSAALLWTAIGGLLFFRGINYLYPSGMFWLGLLGVAAGTAKSFLILDRSARRGLERIQKFSDNTCIGAVYSWKTWLVVLAMIGMGIVMRKTSLPSAVVGTVCIGIGWALVFSSRHAWISWFRWKNR